MYIRIATPDDLVAITEVHSTAFHNDTNMDYPFPNRRDFPEVLNASTKERFRSYFAEPETYLMMVACSTMNKDHKIVKPVAYAAWRLQDITSGEDTNFLLSEKIY